MGCRTNRSYNGLEICVQPRLRLDDSSQFRFVLSHHLRIDVNSRLSLAHAAGYPRPVATLTMLESLG